MGVHSWVSIEYNKGNHDLARNPILVIEKVEYHLTKCVDYHQIKTVIIPIGFTISCNCHANIEMVQQSAVYTFTHLFVPKNQITKSDFTRLIVFCMNMTRKILLICSLFCLCLNNILLYIYLHL